MPQLGRKHTCYSCHTKFYDLGKPVPLCPKCGADQRESDDAPVTTSHRSRRAVVEVPAVAEDDFEAEATPETETEDDEFLAGGAAEEEEEEEEEEEF